jgi:hypothetical protein
MAVHAVSRNIVAAKTLVIVRIVISFVWNSGMLDDAATAGVVL